MALDTTTSARPRPPSTDYRQAELALWAHYGLGPTEQYVDIPDPSVRLRIVELGAGSRTSSSRGTWSRAPRGRRSSASSPDRRCLLVDRPGKGSVRRLTTRAGGYGATCRGSCEALRRSSASDAGHGRRPFHRDGLGTCAPRSRCLRGSSRVVLLGSGPVVDELEVPGFIARIASPLGAIIVRLPLGPGRARSMMRDSGHGATLDAGGVPDDAAELDGVVRQRAPDRCAMSGRWSAPSSAAGRWKPGLTFDDGSSRRSTAVSWVVGRGRPIGSIELWRRIAALMRPGRSHNGPGRGPSCPGSTIPRRSQA